MKFAIENIHRIPFRTSEFSEYRRSERHTLLSDVSGQLTVLPTVFTQNVLRSGRQRGIRRYANSRCDGVHTIYFKLFQLLSLLFYSLLLNLELKMISFGSLIRASAEQIQFSLYVEALYVK
jgi:hypothetical protein